MPIIQIVMFRLLINWIIKRKKTKIMKYEITKEQIESLRCVMNISSCENGTSFLKEWFPEAFKPVLEVGKWYISDGYLINKQEADNCYGFELYRNSWVKNVSHELSEHISGNYREATESEVFEALKNEAVRRGYKNGNFKCLLMPDFTHEVMNNFHFQDNMLFHGESNVHKNNVIFKDGQWAEIIETISKEEAEKLLNKKII